MRRTLTLAALIGIGVLPVLGGPPSATVPPAPEVERLIEQLGDRRPQARESASKALAAFGPEVLPALRRAMADADPEVRRRLGLLIDAKETAARIAPKRVTLKARGKPMAELVADLARQTGYKIELSAETPDRENQVFDIDIDNLPFWEALRKLSVEGGLVLQPYYRQDGQLTLQSQDRYEPYVHHEGIFRVAATGFFYNRQVQFAAVPRDSAVEGQRTERLSFSLSVTVEPRLRMLSVGPVQIIEATDEHGNSLRLPEADRQAMFRHDGYKTLSQNASVSLAFPDRQARRVKRLRGSIPVTVLLEERPDLVVDKVLSAKNETVKSGTVELTVEEATEEKEGTRRTYKIKMRLRDTDKNNTLGVRYALDQRLELQDAKGNKYRSWGYSLGGAANDVTGTFEFTNFGNAGVEAPVKLVYYTWVTLPHHVTFDFADLPLP